MAKAQTIIHYQRLCSSRLSLISSRLFSRYQRGTSSGRRHTVQRFRKRFSQTLSALLANGKTPGISGSDCPLRSKRRSSVGRSSKPRSISNSRPQYCLNIYCGAFIYLHLGAAYWPDIMRMMPGSHRINWPDAMRLPTGSRNTQHHFAPFR